MPDDTGKLSTTEQDEVIKWLFQTHGGVSQCLLCGSKEGLGVGAQLVAPVPINMKGHAVGAQTYPLVTLTCRACHHVSFVNVVDII